MGPLGAKRRSVTHAHTHSMPKYARMLTHMPEHISMYTHTPIHAHVSMCTHKHAHRYICNSYICTQHEYIHTCIHSHMHTQICTHAHAQAHISSHTQLVTSMKYFLSIGKDSAPTASRAKDPTRVGCMQNTPSCWHLSGLSWDFQQMLPGPMSLSPHTSHLSPGEMLLSDKGRERESQA